MLFDDCKSISSDGLDEKMTQERAKHSESEKIFIYANFLQENYCGEDVKRFLLKCVNTFNIPLHDAADAVAKFADHVNIREPNITLTAECSNCFLSISAHADHLRGEDIVRVEAEYLAKQKPKNGSEKIQDA